MRIIHQLLNNMAGIDITTDFKNGDPVYIFDHKGKFILTAVSIVKLADAISGDDDTDISYVVDAEDDDGNKLIRQQLVTWADADAAKAYIDDI